jgi:hypothetical protein
MILLFLVFAWIGLLSIVVGLCQAAQLGHPARLASVGEGRESALPSPARATLRTTEPRRALFDRDRDGVAA